MKLIKPTTTVLHQDPGTRGIFQAAAEAAYICYQTDPNKARMSPEEFLRKVVIPKGHNRVLEFGTVYMEVSYWYTFQFEHIIDFFKHNNWSRCTFIAEKDNPRYAITTNLRVIVENSLEDFMGMFLSEPTVNHAKRYSAELICSRGALDDMRTHVGLSSMGESTRFCNYSKGKFGNELTFIDPYWAESKDQYDFTIAGYKADEERYLIGAETFHMEPQQLKRLLPLGIKSTLRLCGFKEEWDNFFRKRCHKDADPECQLLANQLKNTLYE